MMTNTTTVAGSVALNAAEESNPLLRPITSARSYAGAIEGNTLPTPGATAAPPLNRAKKIVINLSLALTLMLIGGGLSLILSMGPIGYHAINWYTSNQNNAAGIAALKNFLALGSGSSIGLGALAGALCILPILVRSEVSPYRETRGDLPLLLVAATFFPILSLLLFGGLMVQFGLVLDRSGRALEQYGILTPENYMTDGNLFIYGPNMAHFTMLLALLIGYLGREYAAEPCQRVTAAVRSRFFPPATNSSSVAPNEIHVTDNDRTVTIEFS